MRLTMSSHLRLNVPSKRSHMYQPNVGEDLDIVRQDHCVLTHPATNRNRRTLVITKDNGSWGFTLQTYGIHHVKDHTIEYLTYVDYVELGGPADLAGMRKGDIILSIDGRSMENIDHHHMVEILRNSGSSVRVVVLFEDCSRKVELHLRYMKLKNLLMLKEKELLSIDKKINSLQQKSSSSLVTSRLDNELSSEDDSFQMTPTVNALATLPRKPKLSEKRTTLLSKFSSNTHLSTVHSNPQLVKSTVSNCREASVENGQLCTEENVVNKQLCVKARAGDTQLNAVDSQEQLLELSSSQDNVASSQHDSHASLTSLHVVEKESPSSGLLCKQTTCNTSPDQYNSLPVRGAKKRPKSLLIPDIIISQPANTKVCTGVTTSCSDDSISPDLVCGNSVHHVFTHDATDCRIEDAIGNSDTQAKSCSKDRMNHLKFGFTKRPISFRGSFRHSMSPADGLPYVGSSNHVLTEHNSRLQFDPELLRIKQGHLDLHSPDYLEKKQLPVLFRSLSSPAMKIMSVGDAKEKLRRSADEQLLHQIKTGPDLVNMAHITEMMRNKPLPSGQHCTSQRQLKMTRAVIKSDSYCDTEDASNLTTNSHNYTNEIGHCRRDNPHLSRCKSCCSLGECNQRSQQSETLVNKGNKLSFCDKNGNVANSQYRDSDCLNQPLDGHQKNSYNHQCSKHLTLGIPRSQLCLSEDNLNCEPHTVSRSSSTTSCSSSQSNSSSDYRSSVFRISPDKDVVMPKLFRTLATSSDKTNQHSKLQILNYTRHKDILALDGQFVNERDEFTKL